MEHSSYPTGNGFVSEPVDVEHDGQSDFMFHHDSDMA